MNSFGFNGFNNPNNFNNANNENPLMQYLKQYTQNQPPEQPQQNANLQSSNYSGIKVYEIRTKDDLTYIKPDTTGQKQIILCESDENSQKAMYIARYNYATEKPDYEKYISEGNIELFKKNDTSEEMSQIAKALVAVVDKLESMDNKIEELKIIEPIIEPVIEEPKPEPIKTEPPKKEAPKRQYNKRK